jgi:hypothetical protein
MPKNRTTPVPPFLEPLIETGRLIPLNINIELPVIEDESLNFELRTYDDIYHNGIDILDLKRILEESIGWWSQDLINSYPKKFQSTIKKDLKNFFEYIWGEDSIPDDPVFDENILFITIETERAAARFLDFRLLWNQIKILFNATNKILKAGKILSKIDKWEVEQILDRIPIQAKRKYNTQDGTVSTSVDEFTRALNKGVDIRLIRECKWCHKVFWAGRNDQNCCPSLIKGKKSPCANSYNNFNSKKDKKLDLLKKVYKGKTALAHGVQITYNDLKQNQTQNSETPKTKVLNSAVKFKDILMNTSESGAIYKFEIFDMVSKKDGFVEFKYKNKLEDELKQLFKIK